MTEAHPFAVKRTELIWEGKYDADGRRVAPLRVALPFQTVETVNESAQDRQRALSLFEPPGAYLAKEWRDLLIWGDKKYVLPALLSQFAGKVNLIYIDPPFDTGADFSFTATVPDNPNTPEDDSFSFIKEPSIIEHKAYRDTWGRGLDSYLQWFYETAVLLHELLHETGCIYVHLGWNVAHHAKAIMDEVFGSDHFLNQVVWQRFGSHNDANRFGNVTESILFYSKSETYFFEAPRIPLTEDYIAERFIVEPETGRKFYPHTFTGKGAGPARVFRRKLLKPPPGRHWACSQAKIDELEAQGRLYYTNQGTPYLKSYLDEQPGRPVQNIWNDIFMTKSGEERLGYETQKPEALLKRILTASSNEGDLVLDCFIGSGTTAAVAEKLKRRWIACDLSRFAIHTTRKRLLSISGVRPFLVQNLGKYERQLWAGAEFDSGSGKHADRQRAYAEFILKLYQAAPLNGYAWLHGVKGGRMIHVGSVDAPVSVGDVTQMAAEFKRAVGTGKDAPKTNGVDVIGWDFAFELNEVAKQQAAAANIQLRFLRIPSDVMDKRAVEQGDIHFFELAALNVDVKANKKDVRLELTDFVIPPDDVPEDVRRAVKHWSQWIDYWSVDWNNKGDTFHNEWQTYRTRKDNALSLETSHVYSEPGEYTIVVKVIDILGNDTTKTVKVKVP
jgi:adenine-specific DNA-methyltransferase